MTDTEFEEVLSWYRLIGDPYAEPAPINATLAFNIGEPVQEYINRIVKSIKILKLKDTFIRELKCNDLHWVNFRA